MNFFKKSFYYILKVKDHKENKQRILDEMDEVSNMLQHPKTIISNSDWGQRRKNWFLTSLSERDKLNYCTFVAIKYIPEKEKDLAITDAWFNQYYGNTQSNHYWHNHVGQEGENCLRADLTSIYYVELHGKSLRTKLQDPETKKEIIPRVNEGDILIMSSDIYHSSPPNITSHRKSIISFNTVFEPKIMSNTLNISTSSYRQKYHQ